MSQELSALQSRCILGVRIDNTSYADAAERIVGASHARESGYVCAANVHMVMEAHDNAEYRGLVNGARLVTPDGVPLVWMLRWLGAANPSRVYGPDLTLVVLEKAARAGVPVGFYGSTEQVLSMLIKAVRIRFPELEIAYAYSPPFGAISADQDADITEAINVSGAAILFVGLGCPRQEWWMAKHSASIGAIMLGVGAAFDFIAGCKPQAAPWLQRFGLEWLFRLATEPGRLWKRYARHNPRFVGLMCWQLLGNATGRNRREGTGV